MSMQTAKSIIIGGVGSSLSISDIVSVANGALISIDAAAFERIKKFVIKDGKNSSTDISAQEENEYSAENPSGSTKLTEKQCRAVIVVRLLTLLNGKTGVRPEVVKYLEKFLSEVPLPELPGGPDDFWTLLSLAEAIKSTNSLNIVQKKNHDIKVFENDEEPEKNEISPCDFALSKYEKLVLSSGCSASSAISVLDVNTGKLLIQLAIGISALSFEALGADTKSLSAENFEICSFKEASDVGEDLRCLLESSQRVNLRKEGVGSIPGIFDVPIKYGQFKLALNSCLLPINSELNSQATSMQNAPNLSYLLSTTLTTVIKCLFPVLNCSLRRITLLASRLVNLRPIVIKGRGEGGSGETEKDSKSEDTEFINKMMSICGDYFLEKLSYYQESLKQMRRESVEFLSSFEESPRCVKISLLLDNFLALYKQILSIEALLCILSLRALEGPVEETSKIIEPEVGKKMKKSKKGMVIGKGSSMLRNLLESILLLGHIDENSISDRINHITTNWPLFENSEEIFSKLDKWYGILCHAFNTYEAESKIIVKCLRSHIEANQVQRKPKIPKGTRDFMPEQMKIREIAFSKIEAVFKRHGAVSIDTPVFELRETLMGKYGEDSKLIYDLADQGGEILSLRYDLTVPFARFVAMHSVGNIKRYHIGKVYRRDQPQMTRGRFREFFQCDFDIAGNYALMVADAEAIKVLDEILDGLNIGQFEIKLNHRKLLDGIMAIADIPAAKFRTVCSSIDKLDKETWEHVRQELIEDKGIKEEQTEILGKLVMLKGKPKELICQLPNENNGCFSENTEAATAIKELEVLFGFLESMKALGNVTLDLSLARGLDYYSGVIYEAVLTGASVGSIAAGGRYDKLVGMFSGKDVPAVGVSIGIERIFSIIESQVKIRETATGHQLRASDTKVFVGSIGNGLQNQRMEICSELWKAGIAAEFGYKPNPKMADQLNYVLENSIPFMILFGQDELNDRVLKIKDLGARIEDVVPMKDIIPEILTRLNDTEEIRMVSNGSI